MNDTGSPTQRLCFIDWPKSRELMPNPRRQRIWLPYWNATNSNVNTRYPTSLISRSISELDDPASTTERIRGQESDRRQKIYRHAQR